MNKLKSQIFFQPAFGQLKKNRQTYQKGTAELSKIAPDVLGTSDGVFLSARRTFVSKIFQRGTKA